MKPVSAYTLLAGVLLGRCAHGAAVSSKGCFSSTTGLTLNGSQTFNSMGACSSVCLAIKAPVMAMQDSECYCGSKLPPTTSSVDDSKCSISCPGYPADTCGGSDAYSVYLTGISAAVGNADPQPNSDPSQSSPTSALKSSPTIAPSPSVVTVGGQTVVVTANPEIPKSSSASSSGDKPNKAGIAAGIIVGMLIVAAIIGGFILIARNRKRRAIEAEHRQAAAVSSFIDGGKNMGPVSDTRLDPTVMASRRMSDGSIADDQDYSRRILKVTNA
ncbi:hypothetical protein K3495_g1104 [Podosphaera aphanis]|nr:hypothetical protein K3495_g1104 [Podosphaera aphanis]